MCVINSIQLTKNYASSSTGLPKESLVGTAEATLFTGCNALPDAKPQKYQSTESNLETTSDWYRPGRQLKGEQVNHFSATESEALASQWMNSWDTNDCLPTLLCSATVAWNLVFPHLQTRQPGLCHTSMITKQSIALHQKACLQSVEHVPLRK